MTIHKVSAGDGYDYLTRQVAVADQDLAKGQDLAAYEHLEFENFYVQPMDGPLAQFNTQLAIDTCRRNPKWKLTTSGLNSSMTSHMALSKGVRFELAARVSGSRPSSA